MMAEGDLRYEKFRGAAEQLGFSSSLPSSNDDEVDFSLPPSASADDGTTDETAIRNLAVPLFEPSDVASIPEADPLRNSKRQRIDWKEYTHSDRILRSHANVADIDTSFSNSSYSFAPTMATLAMSTYACAAKLSTRRALKGADAHYWREAIIAEMESLLRETLVPEEIDKSVPYQLIRSTMQLKLKRKDDGSIDKFKARCCARGDLLAGLIADTYSPTVGALTFSLVHQLAVLDVLQTCTIDTVGAYLYQDYPIEATSLYRVLEPSVAAVCGLPAGQTYRVRKYLYGLPDAGRAYYQAYSSHLIENGYTRSGSDPCLFYNVSQTDRTYVFIHVDDTYVASTSAEELVRFRRVLEQRFDITVNHEADSYLGVHLDQLANGAVKLTQPKLLAQIFEEFNDRMNPYLSKATSPQAPTATDTISASQSVSRTEYLHLLGALLYVTKSRPDISTAVSYAATHSVEPSMAHYNDLLRCVAYLYNTRDNGLILHRGIPGAPLTLRCYVDASYLTHGDSRGHTGYCLSLGTIGCFYAKSSKQSLVTTSSTHAELRALFQLTLDIIYVINLCAELERPVQLPAIIMEDNQPAIDLVEELTGRTKKCKHFLMLINFIREQVAAGLIALQKVSTEDNIADLLTKPLLGDSFWSKASWLLGIIRGST